MLPASRSRGSLQGDPKEPLPRPSDLPPATPAKDPADQPGNSVCTDDEQMPSALPGSPGGAGLRKVAQGSPTPLEPRKTDSDHPLQLSTPEPKAPRRKRPSDGSTADLQGQQPARTPKARRTLQVLPGQRSLQQCWSPSAAPASPSDPIQATARGSLELADELPAGTVETAPAGVITPAIPPLPDLNDLQRSAVFSSLQEPSLIIAGAGSGKTTVMLERVRYALTQEGIPAKHLLMVTFSRKAAKDLTDRLLAMGVAGAKDVSASTFHSYGYRLIRRYYTRLGFTARPTIWGDDADRKGIVKEAIRKAQLEDARKDVVHWMRLDPHSTWTAILPAVQAQLPAEYRRWVAAADAIMHKERAKEEASAQRRAARLEMEGTPSRLRGGVDSESAVQAALDRASLLERAKHVYNGLYQRHMHRPQRSPHKGAVPDSIFVAQMAKWIAACKQNGQEAGMHEGDFGAAFHAYQEIFHACNAMDYNDMLSLAHRLLATNADILHRERERYQYLLVDEFQDCNPVQIGIVELLQRDRGQVTVVGDDAQSIYGFLGADHRSFTLFEEAFGQDIRRFLTVNYRSTPAILKAATVALAGTQPSHVQEKELIPHKPSSEADDPVRLQSYSHPEHQAKEMVDKMQHLHQQHGIPYEQMAVVTFSIKYHAHRARMTECFVARRGKTADLQAELGRRGIKFQVLKEKPLLERRVAKDALALLQLALNLHDDLAFQRILARPAKHLGPKFLALLKQCRESLADERRVHVSLFEAALRLQSERSLPPRWRNPLGGYLKFLRHAKEGIMSCSPSQAMYHLLKASGYLDWLKKQKARQARRRRERQNASRATRQPSSESDDSDHATDDDDDDDDDEADDAEEDPEHLAMRSAQDLGAINRSLFQLHGLAVRFEREWVNPWRDTDTPATDADVQPPPLQSLLREMVRTSVPVQTVLQQVPSDEVDRIYATKGHGPLPLGDLLGNLATESDSQSLGPRQQGVYIGTIHSVKGLEREAVWVFQCHEDELPWKFWLSKCPPNCCAAHPLLPSVPLQLQRTAEQHFQEQHRLVYVALTRARRHLFLTCLRYRKDPEPWQSSRREEVLASGTPWSWAQQLAASLPGEDLWPSEFLRRVKALNLRFCQVEAFRTAWDEEAGMPDAWRHI